MQLSLTSLKLLNLSLDKSLGQRGAMESRTSQAGSRGIKGKHLIERMCIYVIRDVC